MRRRPSKLVTATATVIIAVPLVAGCEAKVYGTTPEPAAPQLTVVVPQGRSAPLPEAPPDEPAATFDGLDARARQATADAAKVGADISTVVLDRNTGQVVSNGNARPMPDRLGGQAVHRRRPAAAGVEGPDAALPRRPRGARRHAAVLRRQRRRSVLEPQRRQRDHHARHRAVRAEGDDDALQRALVQHLEHDRRPRALLRHAAGRAAAGCRPSRPASSCPTWRRRPRWRSTVPSPGAYTHSDSASPTACSPNPSRSSRAGCAAGTAATGCTCLPA